MPDASHVKRALQDTFVIVQDAFHSDTVACADVVLPAATWGESRGTTTNMERRVSRVTAATDPPGEARQDIDIIAAIGNQIQPGVYDTPPVDPASVFDEIRTMTAGTSADLSGVSYERLEDELAVRWPAPTIESEGGYRYYDRGGWTFHTDSGRAQFSTVTHSRVPEPADDSYPLTLTTGRVGGVYNTGVRSGSRTSLPRARVHPDTIVQSLAALNHGQTEITSRRGSITVDISPSDNVPPGMVWLPIHDAEINELTLAAVDPDSAEPNLKQCAVKLSPPTDRQKLNTPVSSE
jgi:assimilatory nitrate reductase catalytic subunit